MRAKRRLDELEGLAEDMDRRLIGVERDLYGPDGLVDALGGRIRAEVERQLADLTERVKKAETHATNADQRTVAQSEDVAAVWRRLDQLDAWRLEERVAALEGVGHEDPEPDQPESGEGRTWWRHPQSGRRLVAEGERFPDVGDLVLRPPGMYEPFFAREGDRDSGNRHTILRPAQLFPGGPTGWCVEVGEKRSLKPGDWYLSPWSELVDRAGPRPTTSGRPSVPCQILEPLPESEFAAHGVEKHSSDTPVEDTPVPTVWMYDGEPLCDPQDTSEADVPARHLRGWESDPQDTPHIPEEAIAEAYAAYNKLSLAGPHTSAEVEGGIRDALEAALPHLREQWEREEAEAHDEFIRAVDEADKPGSSDPQDTAPSAESEIDWPVEWTDGDGDAGIIDRVGLVAVKATTGSALCVRTTPSDRARIIRALQAIDGIEQDTAPSAESDTKGEAAEGPENEYTWHGVKYATKARLDPSGTFFALENGNQATAIDTTPADRARIIRALQAIDGTNETQRKEDHGRTTGTTTGRHTPREGGAAREGAGTPPPGSWSGDLDHDDAADPGVRGKAARGDRGGVLGTAPTEDEELFERVAAELTRVWYQGWGHVGFNSGPTARYIIDRVRESVAPASQAFAAGSAEVISRERERADRAEARMKELETDLARQEESVNARQIRAANDRAYAAENRIARLRRALRRACERALEAERRAMNAGNEVDKLADRLVAAEARGESAEPVREASQGVRAVAWSSGYRAGWKEAHSAVAEREAEAEPVRVTDEMIAKARNQLMRDGYSGVWPSDVSAALEAALAQTTDSEGERNG